MTQFADQAAAFAKADAAFTSSPVDQLVQYPARGNVGARLAGVVVGIVDGVVYIRELADIVTGKQSLVLATPTELEYATPAQAAQAGRYLAAAHAAATRFDGVQWPPR